MVAYAIFIKENVLDQSELDAYSTMALESFEGHQVKPLAAYGAYQVLEGPAIEGAVILEFPDREAALKWYESPAYQAALQHRLRGASYRGIVVEGI